MQEKSETSDMQSSERSAHTPYPQLPLLNMLLDLSLGPSIRDTFPSLFPIASQTCSHGPSLCICTPSRPTSCRTAVPVSQPNGKSSEELPYTTGTSLREVSVTGPCFGLSYERTYPCQFF